MKRLLYIVLSLAVVCLVVYSAMDSSAHKDTAPKEKLSPAQEDALAQESFKLWKSFTPPTGEFKALFPSLPQHAAENTRDPHTNQPRNYVMYVSEKPNGTLLMVSMITYPKDGTMAPPTQILHNVMQELMTSNPANKLISEKENPIAAYPSLDFSIKNKEVRIENRGFIKDHTLFLLTFIAKNEEFNEKEYMHFLDSFELLK